MGRGERTMSLDCNVTTETYFDVRWQCRCGRFVKESAIESTDHFDPTAYFGITTISSYECGRCGSVAGLPRLIEVKEYEYDEPALDISGATE
jgi:hypothetical protein